MLLFLIGLACLFPLSLYCLYLAMLHQRAHPTIVSGAWDMAGVLIAVSGFLLAGGTTVIFAVHAAVRDYWLQVVPVHSLGGVYARIGAWTFGLWGFYFLALVVGGAYLLAARRECTSVYHISPAEMDELLAAALGRLGLPVDRRGARWVLGKTQEPIDVDKLVASGLRPADKGVVDVEGSDAMRCVTLRWKYAGGNVRADVEAELAREVAAFPVPPGQVSTWLMTASASLFVLMIFLLAAFLLIVL